ncbi:MAG TPA: pilus assembly protein TadG-related protein [Terracidiphilus sp.]|nr:pilus assembly protein TadG-related protein [Terracidiphilus sp.]
MMRRQDESGQMLIVASFSTMVLCGLLALSIDVGLLFRARRNMQIVADAAATAGALDYYYNASTTSAGSAAQAAATSNGVTNGTGGAVVTVNIPPLGGPNMGTAGYVEAIVSEPNPTIFMSMFGFHSITVAARAVAGTPGASQGCVYVLDPTASDAMELQGSFDVSVSHCGVVVDSNASDALQFTGSSGSLTAGSVSVVGGDGGQTGDSTPTPITGAAPANDPINISGPVPPGGCSTTSTSTSLTGTIPGPGAGLAICFSNAVSLSNVTLGQGIYVFEKGATTSGNINSGAGGATLDIYSGSLTMNSGTVLNLVAPTAGPTNGIAIMEPSSNSSQITIQKGNATGSLTGIIYAPGAELYLQDSGGDSSGGITLTTDLIVDKLFDKTATLTITSYSAVYPSTTPLRAVALVE